MFKQLITILFTLLFILFLSMTAFSDNATSGHLFSPDVKEILMLIGFLVSVIIAPLLGWLVKKLIDAKEIRDARRHEDILFMFDNHKHVSLCTNKECGNLETVKVLINIPQHDREG